MPVTSHSKSRRGCTVCKRRKVKCGEELPACLNCVRRGEPCAYPSYFRFKTSNGPSTSAPSALEVRQATYVSPSPLSVQAEFNSWSGSPFQRRAFEPRLIHFFTVSTCHTWSPLEDLWMTAAPQAGFQHSFLLDAILATATLHWSVVNPRDRHSAKEASMVYYSRALQSHNESLQHVMQIDFSLALLLTSALVSFYTLVSLGHTDERMGNGDDKLFQWIRLARGVSAVYRACSQHLNGSDVMRKLRAVSPDIFLDEIAFDAKNRERYSSLLDWSMEEKALGPQEKKDYMDAISYTGYIHEANEQKEKPVVLTRRVVAMLPRCGPCFTDLLEERRPRALVILAHAFAALKPIEHELWWLDGIASQVQRTIGAAVPEVWQPLMPQMDRPWSSVELAPSQRVVERSPQHGPYTSMPSFLM